MFIFLIQKLSQYAMTKKKKIADQNLVFEKILHTFL